jgi:hypothetical protein
VYGKTCSKTNNTRKKRTTGVIFNGAQSRNLKCVERVEGDADTSTGLRVESF